jgi:hypothetical protein
MAEPVRARLGDEEGRRLLQIVRRGKHGSVRVRRAMIIMASASGKLACDDRDRMGPVCGKVRSGRCGSPAAPDYFSRRCEVMCHVLGHAVTR